MNDRANAVAVLGDRFSYIIHLFSIIARGVSKRAKKHVHLTHRKVFISKKTVTDRADVAFLKLSHDKK